MLCNCMGFGWFFFWKGSDVRMQQSLQGFAWDGEQWENGGCGRARSHITAWADARYYRLAAPQGWQQEGGQLGHPPPPAHVPVGHQCLPHGAWPWGGWQAGNVTPVLPGMLPLALPWQRQQHGWHLLAAAQHYRVGPNEAGVL